MSGVQNSAGGGCKMLIFESFIFANELCALDVEKVNLLPIVT